MSVRVWCALLAFLALPAYAQNSSAPTVTLKGAGTIVGVTNLTTKQDTFLGIPYALAPLGVLRFAAPAPLPDEPSRVIHAAGYGPACLQPPSVSASTPTSWVVSHLTRFIALPNKTSFPLTRMSEDCLTINVVRPAGLNHTAKLPVMVWIYGGSFVEGGSSIYGPQVLVGQSMRMVRDYCPRRAPRFL